MIAGPRDELLRWEANEKAIDAEIEALKRSITGSKAEKKAKEEALKPKIEAIEARRRPNPGRIAAVVDVSSEPVEIPILVRGNYAEPGRKVGPGVPGFLSDPDNRYEPDPASAGPGSTGRRLALARWLTRPGSRPAALLARVLANRIWQDHFGTGLAATPENLGYTGTPPSHPELLEFLAAELARSGWSARAMHRMIVTSTAYRQSSAPRLEAARIDPDNRLLARYPMRRLDAESIRDAMLAASGELDGRPGGPYVPTDRTDSGEVAVERLDPGLEPALGLSPAAPHPGRQPARGLRCPLDRHHLHPTAAVDRAAPVAQPAEFAVRRGPGGQAGRADRPRVPRRG